MASGLRVECIHTVVGSVCNVHLTAARMNGSVIEANGALMLRKLYISKVL
jgi:hypothetical protein